MTDLERALAKITKARASLISNHRFFGTLACKLVLQHVPDSHAMWHGSPTMATDGSKLYFSTSFVLGLPEIRLVGVLAHEVMHPGLMHHTRRMGRDPLEWNICTDYAINLILIDAGFKLPEGVLIDEKYRGLNADQIFRLRSDERAAQAKQERPKQQDDTAGESSESQDDSADSADSDESQDDSADKSSGADDADSDESRNNADNESDGTIESSDAANGKPGQGDAGKPVSGTGSQGDAGADSSGRGDNGGADEASTTGRGHGNGSQASNSDGLPTQASHDPGKCGAVLDAAPVFDEDTREQIEAEWQATVRQALAAAKRQNAGTLPGYLAAVAKSINEPRLNVRDMVRRFIDDSTSKDYSWTRPNRRFAHSGTILPGMVADRPAHIVAIIDSSGSMSDDAVSMLRTELQAALDDGLADKLTFAYADTKIHTFAEYAPGDSIDLNSASRGGTSFRQPMAWIAENCDDASAILYLTDMDSTDYGDEPSAPVLWLVTGHPNYARAYAAKAPFGEAVILADTL